MKFKNYIKKLLQDTSIFLATVLGALTGVIILISIIFFRKNQEPLIVIIGSLLLCLYSIAVIRHFIKTIPSIMYKTPNKFDEFVYSALICSVIVTIFTTPIIDIIYFHYNYIWIIACSFASLCILTLVLRIALSKSDTESTCLTLNDLNEDNMPKQSDFFLVDKESEDDLLSRTMLIEQAKEYIFDFAKPYNRVIGISGKWGSGKSSLFIQAQKAFEKENSRKSKAERKNFIIINDFDCWKYEDERSLFIGIVEKIYSKLKLGELNQSSIKQMDAFANLFLKDSINQFNLSKLIEDTDKSNQIKNLIENCLKVSKKHLVFVFDNLDRISSENFIFVYKAISSSLKFSNTTYVCLYDESIAQQAFDKANFPITYLDKIFSYRITIPTWDNKYVSGLAITKFHEYLGKYGKSENVFYSSTDEKKQIEASLKFLTNPRDTIRFFNFFNLKYSKCDILNIGDLVTLTVIKTLCFDLYELIYNNKELLSSKKYYDNKQLYYSANTAEEIASVFRPNGKYSQYSKLFAYLFPIFVYDNIPEISANKSKEFCKRPIECSGLFDLYFIENENGLIKDDNLVKNQIDKIDNSIGIQELLMQPICFLNYTYFYESYSKYIAFKNKQDIYLKELINLNKKVTDKDSSILIKNSYGKILETLQKKMKDNYFKNHLSDLKNLVFFNDCLSQNETKNLKELITYIVDYSISNSINIFSKSNYVPGILKVFYKFRKNDLGQFIKNIMHLFSTNRDQVYNILNELANNVTHFEHIESSILEAKDYYALTRKFPPVNDFEKDIIYKLERFTY